VATKPKPKPKPKAKAETVFDSCDAGLFLIHKDFLAQMTAGVNGATQAPGASRKNFLQFAVAANREVGLMKPTLKIKHGPGTKESFTFTLALFIPPKK